MTITSDTVIPLIAVARVDGDPYELHTEVTIGLLVALAGVYPKRREDARTSLGAVMLGRVVEALAAQGRPHTTIDLEGIMLGHRPPQRSTGAA